MAYSGIGLGQRPTLKGTLGAGGAMLRGGGKVLAGVGGVGLLAGGAIGRQLGLGGLGMYAAAAGGAFTGGYKMFAGKGKTSESGGTPKNIAKTSMLGGSPEVVVRIAQEVSAIKNILISGKDPASEEREKALDAEVRHRELIDALRSRGLTAPKKEKEGSFWDKLKPLLASLLGIAGLAMLPKLFEELPNVLEKIQGVFDKIGSFLTTLEGWFAALGAGIPAALAVGGTGMNVGRTVNRGKLTGNPGSKRQRTTNQRLADREKAVWEKREKERKRKRRLEQLRRSHERRLAAEKKWKLEERERRRQKAIEDREKALQKRRERFKKLQALREKIRLSNLSRAGTLPRTGGPTAAELETHNKHKRGVESRKGTQTRVGGVKQWQDHVLAQKEKLAIAERNLKAAQSREGTRTRGPGATAAEIESHKAKVKAEKLALKEAERRLAEQRKLEKAGNDHRIRERAAYNLRQKLIKIAAIRYNAIANFFETRAAVNANTNLQKAYRDALKAHGNTVSSRLGALISGDKIMTKAQIAEANVPVGEGILRNSQGSAAVDSRATNKTNLGYDPLRNSEIRRLKANGFKVSFSGPQKIAQVTWPAMPDASIPDNKLTPAQLLKRQGQGGKGFLSAVDQRFYADSTLKQRLRIAAAGTRAAGVATRTNVSATSVSAAQTQLQAQAEGHGPNRNRTAAVVNRLRSSSTFRTGAKVGGGLFLIYFVISQLGKYYAEVYLPKLEAAHGVALQKKGSEPTAAEILRLPAVIAAKKEMQEYFHKECILIATGGLAALFGAKIGGVIGAKLGALYGAGTGLGGAFLGGLIGGFLGGLIGGVTAFTIAYNTAHIVVSEGERVFGKFIPAGTKYWVADAVKHSIGGYYARKYQEKADEIVLRAANLARRREAEAKTGVRSKEDFAKLVDSVEGVNLMTTTQGVLGMTGLPWVVEFNNAHNADRDMEFGKDAGYSYSKNREKVVAAFRAHYASQLRNRDGVTNKYAGAIDAGKWRQTSQLATSPLTPGHAASYLPFSTIAKATSYQHDDMGAEDSKYADKAYFMTGDHQYKGKRIQDVFRDMYNAQKSDFAGPQGRNIGKWGPDAGQWSNMGTSTNGSVIVIKNTNVNNASTNTSVTTNTNSSTSNVHVESGSFWDKIQDVASGTWKRLW